MAGAHQLAHMAAGWSAAEGWGARCQAASLLHFCLSRVRLEPSHPDDAALLARLPALVNVLRAACAPRLHKTPHLAQGLLRAVQGYSAGCLLATRLLLA